MDDTKGGAAPLFHKLMTTKVSPNLPVDTVIPMDSLRPIPAQKTFPEEEMEKKAIHTIHAQLKQAACCSDEKRLQSRWEKIEMRFSRLQYKGQKKKIIEKLDDENNYAPIHYAVRSNNRFICEKLLDDEYNCNVNLLGWAGQTPLHLAVCSADIEKEMSQALITEQKSVLLLLLSNPDIQVNIRDDKGRTPLHHAIMRNHTTICNILLDHRARVNIPDIQGATAIHYAYRFGTGRDILSKFPLQQELFQLKTVDNKTPFEMAAEHGHLDTIQEYFDKRSDSIAHSDHGIRSLIHAAVRQHNSDILAKLVPTKDMSSYMINLACRQPQGYKMLTDPKLSGFFDKKLMLSEVSSDGFTPLMMAVKYRRKECVQILLDDKYCDKTILEKTSIDFERTILHICAEHFDETIATSVLEKAQLYGLDPTPVDVMGNTVLHIYAQKNNLNMCNKLLTMNPANIMKMLQIRNNSGYTAFHDAIMNGNSEIVELMIEIVPDAKMLIEERDDQLQTSLHMTASNGDVKIVDLMISHNADIHARDINDHTPLHEAARSSDSNNDVIRDRVECIEHLIRAGAEVDALNIHRETPLHIACRYSSSSIVRALLHHDANILQTNIGGFNCLEVAIEEKNKNTVQYLIDHDYIFELMRNAQLYETRNEPCCTCGNEKVRETCCVPCCKGLDRCSFYTFRLGLDRRTADTPMRKLIATMPDMAMAILERCTTTIGDEKSKIHRIFFDYEFLEDQYVIRNWAKGNLNNKFNSIGKASVQYNAIEKDEPYTIDYKTLVMNHPLFLMAVHNRYALMAHPLSRSLVNQKFFGLSLILFMLSFALYATFLGIYTATAMRTQHPQYYYSLTGFDYDGDLCINVTDALNTGNIAMKTTVDWSLKIVFYVLFSIILVKNTWAIIGYIRTNWTKIFTFILELMSLGFCYYFLYDYDYQKNVTMRCPNQWEIGACGLFLGYMALLYYIQYIPIFGIYVIMIKQILIRFLLFVPVLAIFMAGFALTLYMVFQNFTPFSNVGFSFAKIVLMLTGEINYDDLMHSNDTTAFYKMGFVLLILLAIILTILVSNLLIGLAVGEIGPMMDSAKDTRLDMLYELAADFEILKYQILSIFNRCCNCCFVPPRHYKQSDLTKQWKSLRKLKKQLLESCAREFDENEISEDSDDEELDYQTKVLEDVRKELQQLQPSRPSSGSPKGGQSKAVSGTNAGKPKPKA
ncbi:unnamed protein product [Adineta ricciae]|uniref:Ion transport domain-containing protein n=1 Tax=Adineta ricciae TaxID=249248 RepID=A0A814KIA9_ADIRI|nr:unnamed protein product [Adineta ricciae]